jgi:hypothetical protein
MGLDMYLYRITDCGYSNVRVIATDKNCKKVERTFDKPVQFKELVNTWRKDYQIDYYFQDKYGSDFNDDNISLDIDAIENLRERCEIVLNDHSLADELLPFLYADYEYDDEYFKTLEHTFKVLTRVVEEHEELEKQGFYITYSYEISY